MLRLVRAGYCQMPDLKHMTLVDCLYGNALLDASEKADRQIAARIRAKAKARAPGGSP